MKKLRIIGILTRRQLFAVIDRLLMNRGNEIGPSMEPCGTPKETGFIDDILLRILTRCVLVDK